MKQSWERLRLEVVCEVKEVWSRFKEAILEVGEEVSHTKRIREEMRRKGSEWRSEEIRRSTKRREEYFLV